MANKKFSELGLIDYFQRIYKGRESKIFKGIGDDAAAIKISRNKYLLQTSDMLIEGRHFRKKDNLFDIGYKSIACSLSDIAAMGGKPKFALVSLGLPRRFSFKDVQRLSKGIKSCADKFSVNIIGGDTNRSDKLIVDVLMTGFVDSKKIVLRNNAKEGDYIFVTGSLGGSILKKHLNFMPRVKESLFLTHKFKLNSMIDISDGLVIDLWRILESSRVGAVLFEDLIPISKDAKSLDEALYMGEDFELLFTVSEKEGLSLLKDMEKKKIGFPLSFMGKIMNRKYKICLVDKCGKLKELRPKGYLHF
ncbi:MAG: thiamine-phosphate kinase [Candidatus Omnitrophota bacterium]